MSQKTNQVKNRPGWRAKSVRIGRAGSFIDEGLSFNPWQSIYNVNYRSRQSPSTRPKALLSSQDVVNLPKIMKIEGKMELDTNGPSPIVCQEDFKENCNNVKGFFLKNKFCKSNFKSPKADNEYDGKPKNNKKKLFAWIRTEASPQIDNGKCSHRSIKETEDGRLNSGNFEVKKESSRQLFTGSRVGKDVSQSASLNQGNLQIKSINFSKLKNRKVKAPTMINPIGQNETWIDPVDEKAPVLHSQIIHLHSDNFLDSNIKNLIAAKNEYYPMFTGKCFCGECICGTCKCVHFKIKTNNIYNRKPDQSVYQSDYVGHMGQRTKTVEIPSELHRFNTKMSLPTTYADTLGKKPERFIDVTPIINRAKEVNIGVGDCGVRGPMQKESQYKNDYPDWKCGHSEIIPPMIPDTFVKNLPIRVKTFNQEYGSFGPTEADKPLRAPNKLHKKSALT